METETYPNRSVPRIFTKYIHSIDKIFPILKIVVDVCQLYVMLLTKYFLLWKQLVNMTGTLKITSITKLVHVLLYRFC